MPYSQNIDLPPAIRNHLPAHAQDIYREAFNHAFAAHAGRRKPRTASPGPRSNGAHKGRQRMGRAHLSATFIRH